MAEGRQEFSFPHGLRSCELGSLLSQTNSSYNVNIKVFIKVWRFSDMYLFVSFFPVPPFNRAAN